MTHNGVHTTRSPLPPLFEGLDMLAELRRLGLMQLHFSFLDNRTFFTVLPHINGAWRAALQSRLVLEPQMQRRLRLSELQKREVGAWLQQNAATTGSTWLAVCQRLFRQVDEAERLLFHAAPSSHSGERFRLPLLLHSLLVDQLTVHRYTDMFPHIRRLIIPADRFYEEQEVDGEDENDGSGQPEAAAQGGESQENEGKKRDMRSSEEGETAAADRLSILCPLWLFDSSSFLSAISLTRDDLANDFDDSSEPDADVDCNSTACMGGAGQSQSVATAVAYWLADWEGCEEYVCTMVRNLPRVAFFCVDDATPAMRQLTNILIGLWCGPMAASKEQPADLEQSPVVMMAMGDCVIVARSVTDFFRHGGPSLLNGRGAVTSSAAFWTNGWAVMV